ncbi:MAG: hypothetical protein V8T01_00900 [Oscillospiraceae bacterium]
MDMHQEMDLQLFADAGTLVNAGGNYVNAYTGEKTAFPEGGGMTGFDEDVLRHRAAGKRAAGAHPHAVCPQAGAAGRARQDRGVAQVGIRSRMRAR